MSLNGPLLRALKKSDHEALEAAILEGAFVTKPVWYLAAMVVYKYVYFSFAARELQFMYRFCSGYISFMLFSLAVPEERRVVFVNRKDRQGSTMYVLPTCQACIALLFFDTLKVVAVDDDSSES